MTLWKKLIAYLEAPRPCKKHGTTYFYQHGWYDEWECGECKQELHQKHCDNWKCDHNRV